MKHITHIYIYITYTKIWFCWLRWSPVFDPRIFCFSWLAICTSKAFAAIWSTLKRCAWLPRALAASCSGLNLSESIRWFLVTFAWLLGDFWWGNRPALPCHSIESWLRMGNRDSSFLGDGKLWNHPQSILWRERRHCSGDAKAYTERQEIHRFRKLHVKLSRISEDLKIS